MRLVRGWLWLFEPRAPVPLLLRGWRRTQLVQAPVLRAPHWPLTICCTHARLAANAIQTNRHKLTGSQLQRTLMFTPSTRISPRLVLTDTTLPTTPWSLPAITCTSSRSAAMAGHA